MTARLASALASHASNAAGGSISSVSGTYADRQRERPERQQPHEVLLGRDDHAPRRRRAPRRADPLEVGAR